MWGHTHLLQGQARVNVLVGELCLGVVNFFLLKCSEWSCPWCAYYVFNRKQLFSTQEKKMCHDFLGRDTNVNL